MEGDSLPVSSFVNNADGTFIGDTTKREKRNISDVVPCWNKDNCISCNLCALACPHAVIKPYLLDSRSNGCTRRSTRKTNRI